MPFAWFNGVFVDDNDATITMHDGGLLHGAGVFTTMLARRGNVILIDRHLARLRTSCQTLGIPLAQSDDDLAAAASELLQRNEFDDARLRVTVTRGQSVRDAEGERFRPTSFMTAAPLPPMPPQLKERGMTVAVESEQKMSPFDIQAGHKTLDYFSRFASLREAAKKGAGEALWFNVHNFLQSGCITNVFIVETIDGRDHLITPPTNEDLREEPVKKSCPYPKSNVLPGITRGWIIEKAASMNVGVQRLPIDINRLLAAKEVFVCNSIMGVMPVTMIEQKGVGDTGTPGEMTKQLAQAWETAFG